MFKNPSENRHSRWPVSARLRRPEAYGLNLVYGMLGVFAEFERDMIAARVQAGIDRARAKGKQMGRPTVDTATTAAVRASLAAGVSIRKAAALHRVGVSTVQRLKAAPGAP
ncbi:MAG: recombinase family protein [Stellaceae bacterium]